MDTYASIWNDQTPTSDKSTRLLIRDRPHRAVAIVSSSHALILRYSAPASETTHDASTPLATSGSRPRAGTLPGDDASSKCVVEFVPLTKNMLADYRPVTPRPIYGTLGLITLNHDVFLCVITDAVRVATLRPGETVERVLAVDFYALNTSEYDSLFLGPDSHNIDGPDGAGLYGASLNRRDPTAEHPCQDVQKLLGNGSFYYSTDFDLTNRSQDRLPDADTFDIDNFDASFLWNSYMISPLVQFRSRLLEKERAALDASRMLTSAIRGYCQTLALPVSISPLRSVESGMPSYLTIISRLSCRRAGTRFNARGIDDDGNVANFVETETIYWTSTGVTFSYAQVRGSVPVFWEQAAGLIPGQQKITVTRSAEGTQPAFNRHFEDLEHSYGAVHVVNLLSESKHGEQELSQLYRYGVQNCPLSQGRDKHPREHALLGETEYDFHAETKGPMGYEAANAIRHQIGDEAEGFAYYLAERMDGSEPEKTATAKKARYVVVLQQEGVFRTNCLDCLDRTNLIQTIISQMSVEAFLGHRGRQASAEFWHRHSSLWADNGDALSKISAGTGALKTSYTRHGKMSLAGAIADARKSATRLYINNFADKQRQTTIDVLLGRLVGQTPVSLHDPINDFVTAELGKRGDEFKSTESITLWVGTFNLNGRSDGAEEDLSAWLCPPQLGTLQPEVVAVGFQEIVELSPQQIMNSDPSRKQMWEHTVERCLNIRAQRLGGSKYVLLRSGQLVGAALCIYVKASVLPRIKNVEGSVKKTGLSGIAGNKGAVAIRMEYANTQLCFVTAHMAAGFANYAERNKDYATIHHGLRFQRNRGIDDHDGVIWMGDFNYRIGLSLEKARKLVVSQDIDRLYENDQLNLQMVAGLAFPYYSEARISFMPTYKYDIGSDTYDSSEKARIPAWTDRILKKGQCLRQTTYASAPLRFSDHRPVYGLFDCTISVVNQERRTEISRSLYDDRKADVENIITTHADADANDTDDEDLLGYEAIEPGLPPASSDRQKWWLDNGKMARSTVSVPSSLYDSQQTIINPDRPINPFLPADEPDWISVPRAGSRLSSFSSLSSSPFEHVSHSLAITAGSMSGTPPRRSILPPPPTVRNDIASSGSYQSAAEAQEHNRTTVQSAAAAAAAPPTLPRRQNATKPTAIQTSESAVAGQLSYDERLSHSAHRSTSATSTTSAASRTLTKAPPPRVARKPAHLTSSTASARTGQSQVIDARSGRPTAAGRPRAEGTPVDLLTANSGDELQEWSTLQPVQR